MPARLSGYQFISRTGNLVYTADQLTEVFRRRVVESNYVLTHKIHVARPSGMTRQRPSLTPAADAEPFEQDNIRFDPAANLGPLRLYSVTVHTTQAS